jgi:plastocyanin
VAVRERCKAASGGRARRAWLAGAIGLALLSGCGGGGGGSENSAATAAARIKGGMEGMQAGAQLGTPQLVTMTQGSRFEPARATVARGTSVAWRNDAATPHTVTANPARAQTAANVQLPAGAEAFESADLPQGQTFTRQLTVAGEYRYVCRIHEASGMVGTIVVE